MNAVKTIIDEWDPVSLFPLAPPDEYKDEIAKIEQARKTIQDAEELGKVIFETFIEAFGDDVFQKTQQACRVIAQKILLTIHSSV